jgi:hypothetical protein
MFFSKKLDFQQIIRIFAAQNDKKDEGTQVPSFYNA